MRHANLLIKLSLTQISGHTFIKSTRPSNGGYHDTSLHMIWQISLGLDAWTIMHDEIGIEKLLPPRVTQPMGSLQILNYNLPLF